MKINFLTQMHKWERADNDVENNQVISLNCNLM